MHAASVGAIDQRIVLMYERPQLLTQEPRKGGYEPRRIHARGQITHSPHTSLISHRQLALFRHSFTHTNSNPHIMA
jgi:hypothetical protein